MDTPDASRVNSKVWTMFGREIPKAEIVFFSQTLMIYIVVITSLANLTQEHEDSKLWIALLGTSLGYLLPNPALDSKK